MTRALPLTERQARTLLRAAPLARGIGNVGIGEVYRAMIAAQEKQG